MKARHFICFWFPQRLIHLLAQNTHRAVAINNVSNVFDITCANKSALGISLILKKNRITSNFWSLSIRAI